jgi:Ca-activated chloride channel family protein
MRLPLLILSLLLWAWQNAGAQIAPADDFFHGGAQLYISNNIAGAKDVVEMGRKFYPDDDKLKKLEELLKQQQQSQSSQSQQSQQDKWQQQKSDSQKNQQQQNQPQKKPEDQQKPDEKPQDQQKSDAQKKDGEQPEDKNAEGQPVKPGEMTPEEAKRLLDAQKGNEHLLQLKPPVKPPDNQKPVKDW